MGKWLAGIIASIITGVAIAYLTGLLPGKSPPPPDPSPPLPLVGYLVVAPDSPIRQVASLTSAVTVCGTSAAISQARATPSLQRANLRVVAAPELYQAFTVGICNGIFVQSKPEADRLVPVGVTDMRLLEVR
jgi:hypothetical protein